MAARGISSGRDNSLKHGLRRGKKSCRSGLYDTRLAWARMSDSSDAWTSDPFPKYSFLERLTDE